MGTHKEYKTWHRPWYSRIHVTIDINVDQILKPRTTYTYTHNSPPLPQIELLRDRDTKRLSVPPTPPQLLLFSVCACHLWHGRRGWEGEKMRKRSVKNKQTLHPICLALQICENEFVSFPWWTWVSLRPVRRSWRSESGWWRTCQRSWHSFWKRISNQCFFLKGVVYVCVCVWGLDLTTHSQRGHAILYMNLPASAWDTDLLTPNWHVCVWMCFPSRCPRGCLCVYVHASVMWTQNSDCQSVTEFN